MTKQEKEKIKKAIKLFKSEDGWHDAMDILYKLVYGREPYKKFSKGLTKSISLADLLKK